MKKSRFQDRARGALRTAATVLLTAPLLACAVATARVDDGSAEARTRRALETIERLDPQLDAMIAVSPDAIAEARAVDRGVRGGPLAGMTIAIKDNIETAGPLPTTAGSLALADNVTGRDAPLVTRLRDAGAVIIGKANLSEWANIRSTGSISGWSALGGQARNPHALNRNACGSSSGSAIVVAVGMADVAIGTETDGSITCPAALTGVVGFKPTLGLVSRTHVIPIAASQDTAGPLARSVVDAARVLTAIAGSDPDDPATAEADARRVDYAAGLSSDALRGTRIGVLRFATGFGTEAAFADALQVLRDAGATLVDIDRRPHDESIGSDELRVLLAEFRDGIDRYLASSPAAIPVRSLAQLIEFNEQHADIELALFDQDLFERALAGPRADDEAIIAARARILRLAGADGIDRMLGDHALDALVFPTMPPAWFIDAARGDVIDGGGAGSLAAVAGYPHLTVPMGEVRGLPVGLSFIGPRWSDATVLSLGHAYEQASRKRIEPTLLPAIEQREDIARRLRRLAVD